MSSSCHGGRRRVMVVAVVGAAVRGGRGVAAGDGENTHCCRPHGLLRHPKNPQEQLSYSFSGKEAIIMGIV